MRLDGKIALVTGGGSGIGKCIAETYAREGARVAMADISAEAAKSAARAIGNNAIALRCDVSKKADVDGVVEETLAAFGVLDILVNNAGATHVNKPAVEISEAEYDRIFAVNVKGIFLACQAVITKSLAVELAPDGIRVCAIAPVATENAAAAVLSRFGAGHAGEVRRHHPAGPPSLYRRTSPMRLCFWLRLRPNSSPAISWRSMAAAASRVKNSAATRPGR